VRVEEVDVPFVVRPLSWFFCLLGRGSFHFVPYIFPLFGVRWVIYDWQSFITLVLSKLGYSFVLQVCQPFQLDFCHLTHNGILTEVE